MTPSRSGHNFPVVFVALALALFAFSQTALAVTPAPDGGYPNNNTAEGQSALLNLATSTGSNNTAIGSGALQSTISSGYNTAVGAFSLGSDTTGFNNTAIGSTTLTDNTSGTENTAVGCLALDFNTTGSNNTANGAFALSSNTNGSDNTAVGYQALTKNGPDAIDNTAVGSGALSKNVSASFSTGVGFNALLNNTASNNTAVGDQALLTNTTGTENTAIGPATLFKNTSGNNNTATGLEALFSNSTGSNNTADGLLALESNKTGHDNIAEGFEALSKNTTGSSNIALGSGAGSNLTIGNNNIDIGTAGMTGEANKIRIGKVGTQNGTFIAGIHGVAVTGTAVVVSTSGQLGVAPSSARFKEAIKPMDKASEAILALKPVTFRYKKEIDPDKIPQFGLVAEEVEKVAPDLVIHDEQGKPFTARYEAINAMLLNEFLKAHRRLEEQQVTIDRQQKEIDALTATMQRVSERVEVSATAPQVAVNDD